MSSPAVDFISGEIRCDIAGAVVRFQVVDFVKSENPRGELFMLFERRKKGICEFSVFKVKII
ncbi:hypothetical protein Hanom_Chr09g00821401 [Helianthus anomalus]